MNKDDILEDDFLPVVLEEPPETELEEEESPVVEESVEPEIPAEENFDNQEKEKKTTNSKAKKIWKIAALSAVGFLAAVYLAGAAYYNSHFFIGTTINGFECSNMNIDQAKQKIMDGIADYRYSLFERDGKTESISGADISLKPETIGDLNEPKSKQNPFLWCFGTKNRKQSVNIIVSMNEDALYEKVQELDCVAQTKQQMESAAELVLYNEEEQQFVLADPAAQSDSEQAVFASLTAQPSDFSDVQRGGMHFNQKNIVNTAQLFDCVRAGIYGLYPDMDLAVENCYIGMSEEANIKQALDTMNRYISAKVQYQNGDEIIPLDRGSIHFWVSVDANYNVYLDEEQVESFVRDLSMKYNTIGKDRAFVTSTGAKITVSGGDYGWKVAISKETEALSEIIRNGEETTREPIYAQKAASHGAIDIGNTYAEISIGAQHVWFYKNGQMIISSDMVSGNPSAGNGTPAGLYRLKYKERNATLVGEDYRTPVSYWMPFNGGIGMHDASWRSSFGGNIYLGGGSHGCINLPPDIAGKIYAEIEPNDPVVVY